MNLFLRSKIQLCLLTLVQIFSDNVYCIKPNYAIQKQSKSIFSNKKYTESIVPARYNTGNHIKRDNSATSNFMPNYYFPDVDYPINILEASKPFYISTGDNNALFTPFAENVINNFNSAITKPKKRLFLNGNKKISTPKKMAKETMRTDSIHSTVTDNLPPVLENNMKEAVSNRSIVSEKDTSLDTLVDEPTAEQAMTADEESILKSEKMILLESDSQEEYNDTYVEYYEYNNTDSSAENNTLFDELVEIFYADDVYNEASFENNVPENSSLWEDAVTCISSAQNSYTEKSDGLIRPITLEESDTCPLEAFPLPIVKNTTNFNIVQEGRKRIGLGPVQNVKQRKFLKYMNKIPIKPM